MTIGFRYMAVKSKKSNKSPLTFEQFFRQFIKASCHASVANFLTQGRLRCREQWLNAERDKTVEVRLYSLPLAARRMLRLKNLGLPILVVSQASTPNQVGNMALFPQPPAISHNPSLRHPKHKANKSHQDDHQQGKSPKRTLPSSSFPPSYPRHMIELHDF